MITLLFYLQNTNNTMNNTILDVIANHTNIVKCKSILEYLHFLISINLSFNFNIYRITRRLHFSLIYGSIRWKMFSKIKPIFYYWRFLHYRGIWSSVHWYSNEEQPFRGISSRGRLLYPVDNPVEDSFACYNDSCLVNRNWETNSIKSIGTHNTLYIISRIVFIYIDTWK